MNIILIYNPRSGSALSQKALRDKCEQQGITIDAFIEMSDRLEKDLRPYLDKKCIIAAIGGDGTLSGVADLLVNTPTIFAPLPGGTLNHFTKDLGIAQDVDEALAGLAAGKVHAIDVGMINKKVFLNNSSIGLYPSSLQTREKIEERLGKWLAAIVGSMQALWRYRSYDVAVNDEHFKTPFIFVGNNDYHLGEPGKDGRKKLDKGILSVYAVTSASRWNLIKILAHALIGRLHTVDDIKTWKTTSLTIHTKRSEIKVSRDGELEYIRTPLKYQVAARKLNVIYSS